VINFRYHLVSIVAVFLALGIGVIMGTAVIDSAVVDRLEAQQQGLEARMAEVTQENDELRTELGELREARDRLADEGGQRLLDGALRGAPVLVVGVRGVAVDGLDDLRSIIETADADYQGTLWLTDRFALDDEDERRDLAQALGFAEEANGPSLRSAAISRLSLLLRRQAPAAPGSTDPAAPGETTVGTTAGDADLLPALREAGFLDIEGPEDDSMPAPPPGTRVVVLSGEGADVANDELAVPLVRALVREATTAPAAPVLAVEATPEAVDDATIWLSPIRGDERLSARVATVDNLDEFAGQLAAVLALQDLASARYGHYGRGEAAQRLLPAPVE
jgi:hypothetical protein